MINIRKMTKRIWEKDGFIMRLAQAEDVNSYYEQNYCPLDKIDISF